VEPPNQKCWAFLPGRMRPIVSSVLSVRA
jgi:hypothetical protein